MKNARGKYITWLDADMKIGKDYLKEQVEYMERNPAVAVARPKYAIFRSNTLVGQLENSRGLVLRTGGLGLIGTGGSTHRLVALKEVGGFDEEIMGAGEDIDILIRILRRGWLLSTIDGEFQERFKENWKDLWIECRWWGYGAHYVRHKHENSISVATRLPPIALLSGVGRFYLAFRSDHKLVYLLLPFHDVFKNAAWYTGFLASHFAGFGHQIARAPGRK